jgi:hypothetical protein
MIDFRYHLVSIVAVFLALAVGIVLGSTELQGPALEGLQSTADSLRSQLAAASSERDSYQAQAEAASQFLTTAAPTLLRDRLAGQNVVLITEPGAASDVITGVRKAATSAGATITGQIGLQPKFYDLSGATQSALGTVNASVAAGDGVTLTPGAGSQTSYQQQAAQLISTAILTKSGNSKKPGGGPAQPGGLTPTSARNLLAAYAQTGFLTSSGDPTRPATLAVIVAPASPPAGGQNDPANQVLLAAGPEFAAASDATVVAGSASGSAQQGSAISAVRASSASAQMSTVDNADGILGQISVVEALASQLAGGKPNSYGISGAAAVSPDPLPSALSTSAVPQSSKTTGSKTTAKSKSTEKAKK